MNKNSFDTYFARYKDDLHFALRLPKPTAQISFISNALLLFISLIVLIFSSFGHIFFEVLFVVSTLNCTFILFKMNPPVCIVTAEKLFFAPTYFNKGPWLYWHEIASITAYPTSISITPHSTVPVFKRLSTFYRFFYPFLWQITKGQPHFSLMPSPTHGKSTFQLADLLIELKNTGTQQSITHPNLILFDCDGTLVDSELISYEIYAKIFAQEGFTLTPEELLKKFSGFSLADMIAAVSTALDKELSPTIGNDIQQEIVKAFNEKLHEIAGIGHLLTTLQHKNIPFCLVSNGLPERINVALTATHLDPFFTTKTIFDVDAAQRGKPAPDLFLYAAHALGVEPHNCLVVEDSTTGILAAHAAGMPVIALLEGNHAQQEWYRNLIKKTEPTLIAEHTTEIEKLFI